MANLLISQAYLIKKSVIPSNVDWILIEPMLELTQTLDIMPLLGSDFYDEIVTQATPATTLTVVNKTLLDTYIIPCMMHLFLARVTPMFKYRYTNKGIVEKTGENSQQTSSSDIKFLVDTHKNLGEALAKRLIDYIRLHPTDYPTYYTASADRLVSPKRRAFDCPIFLPDKNNEELNYLKKYGYE